MEKGDNDSCGEDMGDLVLALNSPLYFPPGVSAKRDGLRKAFEKYIKNDPLMTNSKNPLAMTKLKKTLVMNNQTAKDQSTSRSFNRASRANTVKLSENRDLTSEKPEKLTDAQRDSEGT